MRRPTRVTLKTENAADLYKKELAPLVEVVPGLVYEGLTLLAGAPKAGKSWLALNLALAVANGTRALDAFDTQAGDVLYLALEDGPRRLQGRLHKLTASAGVPSRRLHFAYEAPPLGSTKSSGGLIEVLGAWVARHARTRLVVIDTLGRVRQARRANSDVFLSDYKDAGALQQFALSKRIGLLVVHHIRKDGSGDYVERVSGTHGLTGAADTVLVLTRSRASEYGKLSVTGRDIEEREVALHADSGCWRAVDEIPQGMSSERAALLDALPAHGAPGIGPSALAELLDKSLDSVNKMLRRAQDAGEVFQVKRGLYTRAPRRGVLFGEDGRDAA